MSTSGRRIVGVKVAGLRVSVVWRLVIIVLVGALCAACGGSVEPDVSYKPAFLPVALEIGPSGVSVTGEQSIATPIGEFSIGAHYSLPEIDRQEIYVILRDRKTGYDRIFEVRTGGAQFTAVVNGSTVISIVNNQVTIDITNGTIDSVRFRSAPQQISEGTGSGFISAAWHGAGTRWSEGWQQSWYKPYALTRWAYDDSTIEKWYGIGFIWFLLRLVLAILLSIVDTLLSLGFLLGQLGFLIFGPTGRDVIYGLLILLVLGGVISGVASAA